MDRAGGRKSARESDRTGSDIKVVWGKQELASSRPTRQQSHNSKHTRTPMKAAGSDLRGRMYEVEMLNLGTSNQNTIFWMMGSGLPEEMTSSKKRAVTFSPVLHADSL